MDYSEELIRKQDPEKLDWYWLAQSERLTESLIREYWDIIHQSSDPAVLEYFYHFSKDFLREFVKEIDWERLLYHNKTYGSTNNIKKLIIELRAPGWKKWRNDLYD